MGPALRQTVAALFATQRMSSSNMLHGHLNATLQRASICTDEYLLAVQDTTFYNYSTHPAMKGLGTLQHDVKGVVQHNVLLLNQTGVPLGLIDQQYWSRQGALPFEGKESLKWTKGLQAVNKHLASSTSKVVVIQDREADMLSFFKEQRAPNVELLVRVHQPRKLEIVEQQQVVSLDKLHEQLAVVASREVEITRNAKPLTLTLSLQAARVHVLAGKDKSPDKHKSEQMSLVIARETAARDELGKDVYDDQQAVCWYMLSSLEAGNAEQIKRIVDFYSLRWRIERFHYTMKTGGLQVERLQFGDVRTMVNALSFYSVVAWHMLALTYQIRVDGTVAANKSFDSTEIRLLEKVSGKKIETLEQGVWALARIVGFARSKKQPYPGVKVLAQALERLYYMKEGYDAADP